MASGGTGVAKGKSPRGRFAIPQTVTPASNLCLCLEWPDNAEHLAVLTGFIESLGHAYTWGEPLTADSETLATLYQHIFNQYREQIEGLF